MVDVFGPTEVLVGILDTGVNFGKVFPGHIGEFIVSNFGGPVGIVVFLDEGVVGSPRGVGGVDFSIGVLFVEQFDPGFEASADFDL